MIEINTQNNRKYSQATPRLKCYAVMTVPCNAVQSQPLGKGCVYFFYLSSASGSSWFGVAGDLEPVTGLSAGMLEVTESTQEEHANIKPGILSLCHTPFFIIIIYFFISITS